MSIWIPQVSHDYDEGRRATVNLVAGVALHVTIVLNFLIAVLLLMSYPVLDVLVGMGIAVCVEALLVLGCWALAQV